MCMLMPFHKIISSVPHAAHVWAPIDDENTMLYSIDFKPDRPFTEDELKRSKEWRGIHTENIPGTDHAIRNRANDYLIDRALAGEREVLYRDEGARHAGLRHPGIDGPDRRPHAGAPARERRRDREDQAPAAADAEGPRRGQALARSRPEKLSACVRRATKRPRGAPFARDAEGSASRVVALPEPAQ